MPALSVILLLILTICAHAGHRVALVMGEHPELKKALEDRSFVVNSQDDLDTKKINETLHLFIQGIPTKGSALIYTTQKDPGKLLQKMHTESGADLVIVLSNRKEEQTVIEGDGLILAHASGNFPARLSLNLQQPGTGLIEALRSAARDAGGWLATGPEVHEPDAQRSAFPPDKVEAGKDPGSEWVNAYGMVFCWCPAKDGGFWMSKYEITRREFDAVTRKNPRNALANHPNHPRDGIHWDDISQFVREVNQREGFFKRIPEGWEYALPSESQWLHAAGAGEVPKDLSKYANFADASLFDTGDDFYHYADRSMNDDQPGLALVGSYPANLWGIHDLFGNLWEWTRTFPNADADPKNPGHPVACGGSWVSLPHDCSIDSRRGFSKRTERNFIGFRLVLQQASPSRK